MADRKNRLSNATGNIQNIRIDQEDEDNEPQRDHGDSYDNDINEDFEQDSTMGNVNAAGTIKSPTFTRSSKSKANLHKNASLANLKSNGSKKKRRTSSLMKDETESNGIEPNRFMIKSKSKQRNILSKNMVRASINQKSETRFPAMKNNKLYQSYNDTKYKTQSNLNNKLALKAFKKPAMVVIEENIEKAKLKLEQVSQKRDKSHQVDDEYDKLVLLSEESNILRHELKTLNNSLNIFIEEMRSLKLKAGSKKNQIDPAEHEEKKRIVKEREIENYDKMTRNLALEHNKLSKRLELVSNPQYVFDLKEKVEEMKNYVRELKNNQRKLEKHQKNRDKKLNYMINRGGEIGHMKKINDTHNELTVTRNQLTKVNNRMQKLEETKAHNQEQIASLTDKLDKLQAVAEKHNIDLDQVAKEVEKKHEYEDFAEVKKELLHKKGVMENAIKVQKKKYQQLFMLEKKRYEQLIADKQEMTTMLQQRDVEAQQQKTLIDDLKVKYDKYKAEAGFNNFIKTDSEKQDDKVERKKDKKRSSRKLSKSKSKSKSKHSSSHSKRRSSKHSKSSKSSSDRSSKSSKRRSSTSSKRSKDSKRSKKDKSDKKSKKDIKVKESRREKSKDSKRSKSKDSDKSDKKERKVAKSKDVKDKNKDRKRKKSKGSKKSKSTESKRSKSSKSGKKSKKSRSSSSSSSSSRKSKFIISSFCSD